MQPEVYFLRYSFPCARVKVDFRKTMTEDEYNRLEQAVHSGEPLPRQQLEATFPLAIRRMREIREDYWTVPAIRAYFWQSHNCSISPDLPTITLRLCRVLPARLEQEKDLGEKRFFKAVTSEDDARWVEPLYAGASVGDLVMIHYAYAVERVEGNIDDVSTLRPVDE